MGWSETKLPCPECSSSDAFAINDEGWGTCFSCGHRQAPDDYHGDRVEKSEKPKGLIPHGDYRDLPARRISEETCKFFGYTVSDYHGDPVQVAAYRNKQGTVVRQKIRTKDKDFRFLGESNDYQLFGQHKWKHAGKRLIITEGEIDCLTYGEVTNCKWPVVSLPSGADGAVKAIAANLEFVESFGEVVLMFDQDEAKINPRTGVKFYPGQEAAVAVANLLPPGKVRIATYPAGYKDINDLLVDGRAGDIDQAMWNARPYRPDGIVAGADFTYDDLIEVCQPGYELPYPQLTAALHGLRTGELTLLTAGSGIGKSTLAREIGYHLHQEHGRALGNIYLEESAAKTAQGYIAIHNDIPLGHLREKPGLLSKEAWERSIQAVIHERQYFFKHFGSLDSDNLMAKLRYLATACECDFIILDHISIVVSGQTSSSEGERKDIDILMTKLRSLIEQTGVGVIAIVHLNQPEGSPHEEGGRVTLRHLRGSGSLKQLSDNVIAGERDQQDPDKKHLMDLRVLKCREFGDAVGLQDTLLYDVETGRLQVHEGEEDDEVPDDEIPF